MKNILILFALLFCFQGFGQCLDETHTPFDEDSWLSCETFANPNPLRPAGHWIRYDLGFEYILDSTYIWNYNVWGKSEAGIKEAAIDYSIDGVNWIPLDTFLMEQASGSYKYEGMPGPVFNNTAVRYVLITALSNWGDQECTGFSEIRFDVNGSVSNDPELEIADNYMLVSPNPVVDIADVSITSEAFPEHIGLYDLSGKLLQEQTSFASKNIQFEMKGLPGGIYLVKARVEDQVLTEKIVKVK